LESQLIKAAKKRKREAQNQLYDLYKRYWFAICLRYQTNRQDAEDCLQNGLVKIFSNIGQFNEKKGEFKSWSSKIIVNENLMLLRSMKNTEELTDSNAEVEMIWPETETVGALSAERLTKLIQQLPDGYRSVFNLYVVEGYSHKEISEILSISIGASKSQLSKARRMLRLQIEVLL
jgi:RNA polymerase sigma-70 factor (ECF subfamily)